MNAQGNHNADMHSQLRTDNVRLHSDIIRLSTELKTLRVLLASERSGEQELEQLRQSLFEARYTSKQITVARDRPTIDISSISFLLQNAVARLSERNAAGDGVVDLEALSDIMSFDVVDGVRLGCELVKTGLRRGLFIVNSAFEFKPEYNQRPIALAKEAAAAGYFVIFAAWQWDPEEKLKHRGRIFGGSVLEIGRFDLELLEKLVREAALESEGTYLLTLPSEDFVEFVPTAQSLGFKVIYDIMDEWEEFSEVGQAVWWREEFELRAIQASDKVTAVSNVLAEKFSLLRTDIVCIPNGLRGMSHREHFVSNRNHSPNDKIVAGYFGHLTDAWFDWPAVLDLASGNPDIELRLVGYGEPEWVRERIQSLPNVKLLGFIPADQLAEVASTWHVALIPFVNGPLVRAVDPIKIYEYLYFGLPVIASGMPHLANYPETIALQSLGDSGQLIKEVFARICAGELDYSAMASFTSASLWRERFAALVAPK
ncbi:glycosyltransferase [Ensifer sp.]|uniref:glycosyltransferase n=1 Tax=Ensifer sp. TaxID=1872086 RepID=UPI00289DD37C|nr:glycosyltransferase [Ensifer sp.]